MLVFSDPGTCGHVPPLWAGLGNCWGGCLAPAWARDPFISHEARAQGAYHVRAVSGPEGGPPCAGEGTGPLLGLCFLGASRELGRCLGLLSERLQALWGTWVGLCMQPSLAVGPAVPRGSLGAEWALPRWHRRCNLPSPASFSVALSPPTFKWVGWGLVPPGRRGRVLLR